MKKQLSNFLKLSTLLVGICLLAVSCENETVDIENQTLIENGTNPFIKKGNLGDFQKINSYVSRLKNQNSLSRTESDESSTNFTVIEDSEIYVYTDSNGVTTYTIPIQRDNQVNFTFSNLVIKTVDDNEVESFILNYSPTQDYLNEYVNYDQIPFDGAIEYESLNSTESASRNSARTEDCGTQTVTLTFCSWPNDDPEDGYHVAGASCTPAYMWSETVEISAGCSGGGGSGSSGSGTGGTSGGSGTGGGGMSGPGGPNPTSPIPSDTCESSSGDVGITGNDGCITSADDIERGNLITALGSHISDAQRNWIDTTRNISMVYQLNDFLDESNYSNQSAYQSQASEIIASAMDGTLVNAFPFVKYPPGSNYATLYPKLTEYLKNQLPTLKNNTTIINAIKTYTNLTTAQIQENLEWGKGPTIKVEQLGEAYGKFKKSVDPDSLYLDIDLVNLLETSTSGTDLADAMAFLIGVTVLHEFVHYGDYNNNGDTWVYPQEEGLLFENDVYGQSVWIENAEIVLKNE